MFLLHSQWICIFQQLPKSLISYTEPWKSAAPAKQQKMVLCALEILHLQTRANHHSLCSDSHKNEGRETVGGIFPLKTQFRQDEREVAFWCVPESVRRATAGRMRHSRADSSIIKLPSQSSITQQGSRRPWLCRRWAGVETHTHTMARDHSAITLLGDFQLSLADLLQLFNQIGPVAVAKKKKMAVVTIGFCELTGERVNNTHSKYLTWWCILSVTCIHTLPHTATVMCCQPTPRFTDTHHDKYTHSMMKASSLSCDYTLTWAPCLRGRRGSNPAQTVLSTVWIKCITRTSHSC